MLCIRKILPDSRRTVAHDVTGTFRLYSNVVQSRLEHAHGDLRTLNYPQVTSTLVRVQGHLNMIPPIIGSC